MRNKPYCTAPWNSLTIGEDGSVKTCCSGRTTLGNINNDTIEHIVKNTKLTSIKSSLKSNRYDINCTSCYEQEKLSGVSLRGMYNKLYPDLSNKLKFLDIRWNNLCNLSCIYCDEFFSSTWVRQFGNTNRINIKKDHAEVLEWILNKVDELEEVMLVGGEPLLMKQNIQLLRSLPDTVKISVITNLSYNIEKTPAAQLLLSKPLQNVMWGVSVENTKEKYEYTRNRSKWKLFDQNLRYLSKNKSGIHLNMVYGIFSGFNLLDTIKYFYEEVGINCMSLQPLGVNPELNIFNFPKPVLEHAFFCLKETLDWIETNNHPFELTNAKEMLSKLTDTININSPSITKENFLNKIDECDRWTSVKFKDLWNDEYQLIVDSFDYGELGELV